MAASDSASNTAAGILVYGGGILIVVLIALWIGLSIASKRALVPTDPERQAAYEQRMAVLIAEYDRIGFYDPTRYDRDGNFYPKGEWPEPISVAAARDHGRPRPAHRGSSWSRSR